MTIELPASPTGKKPEPLKMRSPWRTGNHPAGRVLPLTLGAMLLAGCGSEEIQVYHIPKSAAPPPTAGAHPHSSGPHVDYETPAGWEEAVPGRLSVAHFKISGESNRRAEVKVIPLPHIAGRELDIVNIWREELKLPAISAAELEPLSEPISAAGFNGKLFEFVSTQPLLDQKYLMRTLVAMVEAEDLTWFIKMHGEDELVREQIPVYRKFMKQLQFHVPAAAGPAGPGSGPTESPAVADNRAPEWQAPAHWESQPPGSMLLAKFNIKSDDGKQAQVTVSAFPGDVGGLLANVNRWRGQFNLAPLAAEDLDTAVSPLELPGGQARLATITTQDRTMEVILVSRTERTWFFKLSGDASLVEREKPNLISFAGSVRYPGA